MARRQADRLVAGATKVKKKKFSAADRPQFRRDVAAEIAKLGVEVGAIGPDTVVLCTRAEDFDPSSNVLWELEANKSQVRKDVVCSFCRHIVALSNEAYARYRMLDRKPRVCCERCIPRLAIPEVLRPQ